MRLTVSVSLPLPLLVVAGRRQQSSTWVPLQHEYSNRSAVSLLQFRNARQSQVELLAAGSERNDVPTQSKKLHPNLVKSRNFLSGTPRY